MIGTALGWATSLNQGSVVQEALSLIQGYAPVFPIKEIVTHFNTVSVYLSTTIPTAISIAIGTIQCVESAKRAGDFYPTREAMFADGIGTIIASLFGSIFGMTSKPTGRESRSRTTKHCLIVASISLHRSPSVQEDGRKTSLFDPSRFGLHTIVFLWNQCAVDLYSCHCIHQSHCRKFSSLPRISMPKRETGFT